MSVVDSRRSGLAAVLRPIWLFSGIMASGGDTRVRYGQAFLLAMEGDTVDKGLAALSATPGGRELLDRRSNLLSAIQSRCALEAMDAGALGRAYVKFLARYGIDEGYYARMPIPAGRSAHWTEAHDWFRARLAFSHDLRHLIVGYPPDRLGEICLLAFRAGQIGHAGAAWLAALGCLQPGVDRLSVLEAYRRGREARLLDALDWETRLGQPIEAVRASLQLGRPRRHDARRRRPAGPEAEGWPELDVIDAFGPMAGMHAALETAGVGMPCGVSACFRGRSLAEVERAVQVAGDRLPLLRGRLSWIGGRPVVTPVWGWRASMARTDRPVLDDPSSNEGAVWRYRVETRGPDVVLTAVWRHAVADGRSMMHFLATIEAALDGRPPPDRMQEPPRAPTGGLTLRWLIGFLRDRRRTYLSPPGLPTSPGVSWLTIPRFEAEALLFRARAEAGGMAAWMAAATCLALSEAPRTRRAGWISLNLQRSAGDSAQHGGFGFAAASLLIPVRVRSGEPIASLASRINRRQKQMISRGWDALFERFLSFNPGRHLWFAGVEAKANAEPIVSLSWKGEYPGFGANGGLRDVACFAVARFLHVSAHIDATGLSLCLAASREAVERERLLRRIANLMGASDAGPVTALDAWDGPSSDVVNPSP